MKERDPMRKNERRFLAVIILAVKSGPTFKVREIVFTFGEEVLSFVHLTLNPYLIAFLRNGFINPHIYIDLCETLSLYLIYFLKISLVVIAFDKSDCL